MSEIHAKAAELDTPIYREDVLVLLALTVMADKRVISHEITAFIGATKGIEAKLGLVTTFTRDSALAWFENNQSRVQAMLTHENFAPELHALLKRLAPTQSKSVLFDAMLKIAKSDDEFHISEHALIELVAKYWVANYKPVLKASA